MQRRSFLGGLAGIMAAGFAPAAVGSGILMPVKKIQSIDYRHLTLMDKNGVVLLTTLWHEDRVLVAKERHATILPRPDGGFTLIKDPAPEHGWPASIHHFRD